MSKKKTKEQFQGWDLTDALEKEKRAWKITGCKRAGIRAYCEGHKWLTENAKGTGNW